MALDFLGLIPVRHIQMSALSAASAFDLVSSQSAAHGIWFRLQLIVILMSADPSPEERIAINEATHRAIVLAYSR